MLEIENTLWFNAWVKTCVLTTKKKKKLNKISDFCNKLNMETVSDIYKKSIINQVISRINPDLIVFIYEFYSFVPDMTDTLSCILVLFICIIFIQWFGFYCIFQWSRFEVRQVKKKNSTKVVSKKEKKSSHCCLPP